MKYWIRIDDAMDVFAEHAVGGMVGLLANALFGANYIVGLDGVTTGATNPTTGTGIGGWVIHNYRQFYIQLAYVVAVTGLLVRRERHPRLRRQRHPWFTLAGVG